MSTTSTGIALYSWKAGEPGLRAEYINEAVARRSGLDHAEYLKTTAPFFSVPTNRRAMQSMLEHAEASDDRPFELQLESAQGLYWIECSVHKLKTSADGRLWFVSVTTPIDRFKALEHSRDLLAAAVERQPAGVFIVRFDGHPLRPPIVYVNEAFCALTGYARDEIFNGTYPEIIGPLTDRDLIISQATRVAGGDNVIVQLMLYHRSGHPFWAEVRAHPIDEPVRHGVLIVEDITERREKNRTLALLKEAFDQAGDFIIVSDPVAAGGQAGNFVYINRSFCEAIGFTSEELIGTPDDRLYSPDNDPLLLRSIRDNIKAAKPNYREVLIQRKDGTSFWVEYVAKPFEVDGEQFRLSIGRDITARKRTFNQMALLFEALERTPHRVTLYEPDESGALVVSYENDPAREAARHRLPDLWNAKTDEGEAFRASLLAGEPVQRIFAEIDSSGAPAVLDLTARGVRNGDRLGAVLTIERVLATAKAAEDTYQSRLISLARLLPALAETETSLERFAVLRTLLLEAFEAEVTKGGTTTATRVVHVSPWSNTAEFNFGGQSYIATWSKPLGQASITALRFCIEAALEQDSLSR